MRTPPLPRRPFRRTEALALGLTPAQLRGPAVRRITRGVYVAADLPDSFALRCAGHALTLPESAAFSHTAAAQLHGLPLPRGLEGTFEVSVPDGVTPPRRAGMRAHTGLDRADVVTRRGLPLTSVPRTWVDLADRLDLVHLIAAGDAALRITSRAALEDARATARGSRGVRLADAALPLLAERVDSPMETRLRLLLVLAGLPVPAVNEPVVIDGEWLGRPDLSYPAYRIAIEYDGDHHRTDRRQWQNDVLRTEVLDMHGWASLRFTGQDVLRMGRYVVERVTQKLCERGADVPDTWGFVPPW